MKFLTTTGLVFLASAAPMFAQSSVDEVIAQLTTEGFSDIEVEVNDGTIEVEGYRAGHERELVFDAATWEVLSDETHAEFEADDDDDDDDDAEDHDDDESESDDDDDGDDDTDDGDDD